MCTKNEADASIVIDEVKKIGNSVIEFNLWIIVMLQTQEEYFQLVEA